MQTILALFKVGVFACLEKEKGAHLSIVLAEKLDLKAEELEASLHYVSLLLPGILSRNQLNEYSLGADYFSPYFQNSLYFALAYAPVINKIEQILAGDSLYGADVQKDHKSLGISSRIFIAKVQEELLGLLKKEEFEVCVDLGCGSGDLLTEIKRQHPCLAVGVDASRESLEESLAIDFIEGDIGSPGSWVDLIPPGKKIFIASMVLHELLVDIARIKSLFGELRRLFPGSSMYVIEYPWLSDAELRAIPEDFRHLNAVYYYIHPLTKQGRPRSDKEWSSVFSDCKIKNVTRYQGYRGCLIYKLAL
jgi:SAM-dependent methyltransferase